MNRLSTQDMSMLWPDDLGWPQDIGAVGTIDGGGLVDATGCFRIESVRAAVAERLPALPRLRQVLRTPRRGLGRPLWVDAPRVDLEHHVRVVEVRGELLAAVERLRRRPLDRSRPLWEVWFLTGLPGGRVGCFIRAHHAIADGVAGVAALVGLLGTGPVPPAASARPVPSAWALFVDNVLGRCRVVAGVAHPVAAARRLREAWPALREVVAEERVSRISLNRPLGPHRTLAVVHDRLDRVKELAHAHDATVGDVLLAAITGGLRDLLCARGERVEDLVLRAFVPVALDRDGSSGNRTGGMFVPLPVGVADPVQRLRMVAAETAVRRRRHRPPGASLIPIAVLQRAFLRGMAHQRWVTTYLANVPGPTRPVSVAGASVLELFPLVPLVGNVTLGVGALSYAGRLDLMVVADPDACPDVDVFTRGLRAALTSVPASR